MLESLFRYLATPAPWAIRRRGLPRLPRGGPAAARREDRASRVRNETDLLYGLARPPDRLAWDWELAPFGEVARDRRLVHEVSAYLDWRRDGAAAR